MAGIKNKPEYKDAKPYLRIGLALLFRLRFSTWTRPNCLTEAEYWLNELEEQ